MPRKDRLPVDLSRANVAARSSDDIRVDNAASIQLLEDGINIEFNGKHLGTDELVDLVDAGQVGALEITMDSRLGDLEKILALAAERGVMVLAVIDR